jgi:VanZ family protein
MRELRWRRFWLSGVAALVLVVAYLCLRPSAGGEQWFPNADKWSHFLAFLALAGTLLALVERRHYAAVCAGLLAFGGAIEIAQFFMPYGRSAEWLDLAADGLGIVAGLLVSLPIRDSWLQRIERGLGVRG